MLNTLFSEKKSLSKNEIALNNLKAQDEATLHPNIFYVSVLAALTGAAALVPTAKDMFPSFGMKETKTTTRAKTDTRLGSGSGRSSDRAQFMDNRPSSKGIGLSDREPDHLPHRTPERLNELRFAPPGPLPHYNTPHFSVDSSIPHHIGGQPPHYKGRTPKGIVKPTPEIIPVPIPTPGPRPDAERIRPPELGRTPVPTIVSGTEPLPFTVVGQAPLQFMFQAGKVPMGAKIPAVDLSNLKLFMDTNARPFVKPDRLLEILKFPFFQQPFVDDVNIVRPLRQTGKQLAVAKIPDIDLSNLKLIMDRTEPDAGALRKINIPAVSMLGSALKQGPAVDTSKQLQQPAVTIAQDNLQLAAKQPFTAAKMPEIDLSNLRLILDRTEPADTYVKKIDIPAVPTLGSALKQAPATGTQLQQPAETIAEPILPDEQKVPVQTFGVAPKQAPAVGKQLQQSAETIAEPILPDEQKVPVQTFGVAPKQAPAVGKQLQQSAETIAEPILPDEQKVPIQTFGVAPKQAPAVGKQLQQSAETIAEPILPDEQKVPIQTFGVAPKQAPVSKLDPVWTIAFSQTIKEEPETKEVDYFPNPKFEKGGLVDRDFDAERPLQFEDRQFIPEPKLQTSPLAGKQSLVFKLAPEWTLAFAQTIKEEAAKPEKDLFPNPKFEKGGLVDRDFDAERPLQFEDRQFISEPSNSVESTWIRKPLINPIRNVLAVQKTITATVSDHAANLLSGAKVAFDAVKDVFNNKELVWTFAPPQKAGKVSDKKWIEALVAEFDEQIAPEAKTLKEKLLETAQRMTTGLKGITSVLDKAQQRTEDEQALINAAFKGEVKALSPKFTGALVDLEEEGKGATFKDEEPTFSYTKALESISKQPQTAGKTKAVEGEPIKAEPLAEYAHQVKENPLADTTTETKKRVPSGDLQTIVSDEDFANFSDPADLLNTGKYTREAIAQANYAFDRLADAGFTPQELANAGATALDLKTVGFFASELSTVYPLVDLADADYDLADLIAAGYSGEELEAERYTRDDIIAYGGVYSAPTGALPTIAGPVAPEHHIHGPTTLLAMGYAPEAVLNDNFPTEELFAAGFTAQEVADAGYSDDELLAAGYDLSTIVRAPAYVPVAPEDHYLGPVELLARGYTAEAVLNDNFPAEELFAAGFTAQEVADAGYSDDELLAAGYDLSTIVRAPAYVPVAPEDHYLGPVELLARGYTAEAVLNDNFPAEELFAAGFTAQEVADAGYSDDELLAAGYDLSTIVRAPAYVPVAPEDHYLGPVELLARGYTAEAVLNDNFPAEELFAAGFTAQEVADAGYSDDELLAAGYDLSSIVRAPAYVPVATELDLDTADLDTLKQAIASAPGTIYDLDDLNLFNDDEVRDIAKDMRDAGTHLAAVAGTGSAAVATELDLDTADLDTLKRAIVSAAGTVYDLDDLNLFNDDEVRDIAKDMRDAGTHFAAVSATGGSVIDQDEFEAQIAAMNKDAAAMDKEIYVSPEQATAKVMANFLDARVNFKYASHPRADYSTFEARLNGLKKTLLSEKGIKIGKGDKERELTNEEALTHLTNLEIVKETLGSDASPPSETELLEKVTAMLNKQTKELEHRNAKEKDMAIKHTQEFLSKGKADLSKEAEARFMVLYPLEEGLGKAFDDYHDTAASDVKTRAEILNDIRLFRNDIESKFGVNTAFEKFNGFLLARTSQEELRNIYKEEILNKDTSPQMALKIAGNVDKVFGSGAGNILFGSSYQSFGWLRSRKASRRGGKACNWIKRRNRTINDSTFRGHNCC